MEFRIIVTGLLLITLGSIPALAQGRLDRPSFFQDGQQLMNQEIQRLQQQQQQQSSQPLEHPSQLFTINEGQLQWQKFIFREGGFSVWMPEAIQSQESLALDTRVGTLNFEVFATHPQKFRFVAAYSDNLNPTQLSDPDALLGAVRDGIVAKTQFQLTGDRSISFAQYPGKQLSMQNGDEAITFQVFLVNQRVYVLAADQKEIEGLSTDVANFFNSFRLLQ
jgi:hypothetical protein